ncbi:frizzled-7-like protein [Dinothrombium tinctorium]|uniref:Frizzled-7-like protein n=1 Tax=Dinothrombium tinctorium TaxID=1965070 RepID=A0A3S3PIE3_9ACAR|nr:frizzled-7-like protein [Dinothrombium tinctorium]
MIKTIGFIILLKIAAIVVCSDVPSNETLASDNGQCENVKITLCKSFVYNHTKLPNFLNHTTFEEAASNMLHYLPLIKIRCSADFHFFLCTLHAPICSAALGGISLPPCRSLCESAYNGCEPLMRYYGLTWPDAFQCKRFPTDNGTLCVGKPLLPRIEKHPVKEQTIQNESSIAGSDGKRQSISAMLKEVKEKVQVGFSLISERLLELKQSIVAKDEMIHAKIEKILHHLA